MTIRNCRSAARSRFAQLRNINAAARRPKDDCKSKLMVTHNRHFRVNSATGQKCPASEKLHDSKKRDVASEPDAQPCIREPSRNLVQRRVEAVGEGRVRYRRILIGDVVDTERDPAV